MKVLSKNSSRTSRALLGAGLLFTVLCAVCYGTASAIVLIYQPILTAGEATAIKTLQGFAVLPVPFECFPYQGHPPYADIARPNSLLTSAPVTGRAGESNLAAMAGIKIQIPYEENTVILHLEDLTAFEAFELTASSDDLIEATIECVRRMASEGKEHPVLHISGKPGEEAKWARWEKAFLHQDMAKPFTRPQAK